MLNSGVTPDTIRPRGKPTQRALGNIIRYIWQQQTNKRPPAIAAVRPFGGGERNTDREDELQS
jgi:hypothetical protein